MRAFRSPYHLRGLLQKANFIDVRGFNLPSGMFAPIYSIDLCYSGQQLALCFVNHFKLYAYFIVTWLIPKYSQLFGVKLFNEIIEALFLFA